MMPVVFDIEANGLLDTITKIHCIVAKDLQTEQIHRFPPEKLHLFPDFINKYDALIGHNIVGYDIPAIKMIMGIDLSNKMIFDTLLISKLLNPDRENGHSLESWGEVLGLPKLDFKEFEEYSEEMMTYCVRDVDLNCKVYQALIKEAGSWGWSEAYSLELAVAKIIQKQEEYGVLFNVDLARKCHAELGELMKEIEDKVEPLLPRHRIPTSRLKIPPKNRFKKDFSPSALAKKYFGDRLFSRTTEAGDECWIVEYPNGSEVPLEGATAPLETHEPTRLSDQPAIKEWLMSMGWEPTIWNQRKNKQTGKFERTSPKFADQNKNLCPNLLTLGSKVEFLNDVVLWLSYRNRRNVISSNNGTGWLYNTRLEKDKRLSASADTIGTNTGRFAHRVVANIPRVSSIYGKQMRSMFTVPDDYYMVGWDASGLESRIEAHYCVPMDTQALTREGWKHYDDLIEGEDILTYNQTKGRQEWAPVEAKHRFSNTEVFSISNSYWNFRATGNHRWFVEYRNTGRKTYDHRIVETRDLNTCCNIIINAPMCSSQDRYSVHSKLAESKYETDWVKKVLDMSQSQREAWLNGFLVADGCCNVSKPHYKKYKRPTWRWGQNKGNFAEAALLASYLVHDGAINVTSRKTKTNEMMIATLNHRSYISGQRLKVESIGFEDTWCPKTRNGSWVMRQGDQITITGNTYKYDNGEYARELLDGDIHQKNADVFGCDRNTAKTVKYALYVAPMY